MTEDRALMWMTVCILIILGFIVGQVAAVAIAAMIGALIVYRSTQARPTEEPMWGEAQTR